MHRNCEESASADRRRVETPARVVRLALASILPLSLPFATGCGIVGGVAKVTSAAIGGVATVGSAAIDGVATVGSAIIRAPVALVDAVVPDGDKDDDEERPKKRARRRDRRDEDRERDERAPEEARGRGVDVSPTMTEPSVVEDARARW